jgi:hypothetical protein
MKKTLKITPSDLAFDIDGVIADTMTLFLELAHREFGIDTLRYDDIRDYDFGAITGMDEAVAIEILVKIVGGDYELPLHPMAGAPAVIEKLSRHHRPILFVTARPTGEHIRQWLLEVLPVQETDIEVVATGSFEDKQDVLLCRGVRTFVEDRLETCFLLEKAGIMPIVYRQPWNRRPHPFTEVENWQDIESLIAFQ